MKAFLSFVAMLALVMGGWYIISPGSRQGLVAFVSNFSGLEKKDIDKMAGDLILPENPI